MLKSLTYSCCNVSVSYSRWPVTKIFLPSSVDIINAPAFSDSDIADNSFIASSKPKNVSITSDAAFDLVTSSMESAGYKTSTDFWAEGGPSNDWVYVPDSDSILGGYFYYTKSIIPGESTKALMDTITTWFADENDVRDYELIVYAESVQTADKDGVSFSDVDYQKAWIEYLTRK